VLELVAEDKFEIERPELKKERRCPPFLVVLASKNVSQKPKKKIAIHG
jgi:hypothetical protein